MENYIIDLVEKLTDRPSPDKGWESAVAALRLLGATHVSVSATGDDLPHTYRGTIPDDLNLFHDDVIRFIDNPRRQHCRMRTTPCPSGYEFNYRWENVPQEVLDFDRDIALIGGKAATLIPIHGIDGLDWGAVGFMTDLSGEKHEELFQKNFMTIALVAHLGFGAWWKSCTYNPGRHEQLTNREQACLLWLANGLRNDRIAEKLNLSTATIEFHFANVRRKLKSKTREQALARAILSGAISP